MSNWVDLLVVAGLLLVAIAGWRSGVITTAASFAGFIAGALAGAWLVPNVIDGWPLPAVMQAMATLAGMFVLGIVGQAILGVAGRWVRDALDFRPIRLADSASGMVVSVLAFLLCSWMVLSVAASSSLGTAAEQVRTSRAYPILDQVMAGPGASLLNDARDLLATIDVPTLPFNPATLPAVQDPADIDVPGRVAQVARRSVVQVETVSAQCGASSVGSAVVVGPQRVATNAHVVAGSQRVTVSGEQRTTLDARLVYMDSATDVAILYVPELDAPAPEWVDEVPRGTDAVIAGYPGGGRLVLGAARVRGQVLVADDTGPGNREVHVFRGIVRPGNSGGALLDMQGSVLGLVFANALDDDQTGFALTYGEVRKAIRVARDVTAAVSSGPCQARAG